MDVNKLLIAACICVRRRRTSWTWTAPTRLPFAFLSLTPRPSPDSVFPRFKTLSCGVHRLKMENSCLPAGFPSNPFAFGRIPGLTGLTLRTSPSGRKQWQNADRSAAARSLWSRFLHLMQGPMNKVLSLVRVHGRTHTHTWLHRSLLLKPH